MLINLTDHEVVLSATGFVRGSLARLDVVLPASTTPCRVERAEQVYSDAVRVDDINNPRDARVSLVNTVWGIMHNPPPVEVDGVFYIVSTVVARHPALRGRADILIPARVIKDRATGTITGCRALQRSVYATA